MVTEMTPEIEKLIRETHDAVITMQGHVREHRRVLFGNGRPGLAYQVQVLETRQNDCPARNAAQRDHRMFWVAIAGVIVALFSSVVVVFLA